jgi:Asp/Glu/hydantoin racemase
VKIWFQTFSPDSRIDPKWRYFDEQCHRHLRRVARPDTEFHIATVEKRGPKMIFSEYVQYMHIGQVIENALKAEREGFDAFVTAGLRDLGHAELREAVDIPVVFAGEASYHTASLLARRFAVVHYDEWSVITTRAIVERYGMGHLCLPGSHMGHLGYTMTDLLTLFEKNPQPFIDEFKTAARIAIDQGAEMLITDFAATSIFLQENNVKDVDGVPVLDTHAALIKTAEMQVDLRRLGMPKASRGPRYSATRDDITAARRIYGFE